MDLGNWAVIDLETTGADPASDQIIDVGFYQFSHTTLVRHFSSLVHYPGELSHFIQKLTGITSAMVHQAPRWEQVAQALAPLAGHQLIAHNAKFEASFLEKSLGQNFAYQDSIPYLALLSPGRSSLNLESFLQDTQIRPNECHRGLEDAADLLKVLLVKTFLAKSDLAFATYFQEQAYSYQYHQQWFFRFFSLSIADLEFLASQLNFQLPVRGNPVPDQELKTMGDNKAETNGPIIDQTFSRENIQQLLRHSPAFSTYQFRQSQEDLALKVGQCFKNKIHTYVQAPTGTGKTLGNLLPAMLFALNHKEQVLIATGTKTLQEQAFTKDLPQVRSLLGLSTGQFPVVKMIGAANFFCEASFGQQTVAIAEHDELYANFYFSLLFWFNRQNGRKLGKGDVPYVLIKNNPYLAQLEQNLAVDLDACTHGACVFAHRCAYYQGQLAAKEAQLIIGNHALMFSWPRSFPRPKYVIVDEAHKIEQEVTSAFSIECRQSDLINFQQLLSKGQGLGALFYLLGESEEIPPLRLMSEEFASILHDHLMLLPEKVERWFKVLPRYTSEFFNERPFPQKQSKLDNASLSIFHHFESLHFIFTQLAQKIIPYLQRWEISKLEDPGQILAYGRFSTFCHQLEKLERILGCCLQGEDNYIPVIKYSESEGMLLAAYPLDVGKMVHEQLLETSNSVIFTSATLGNQDGTTGIKGVEWALGHLYLSPQKRFRQGLFLPGIFDYAQKTRIFLCSDAPELNSSNFVPFVVDKVKSLISQIQGRTLLLFSSRKRFEQARELLLTAFEGEIALFIQGMGNQVVEEYRKAPRGILLGMESFGEGIDLPGDILQLLIIDKIPDLRMDHIVEERRKFFDKKFGNEFTDYYLATRCRQLHQKLGRLLRTPTDVGGAIIFDQRIIKWKEKTHQQFAHLMQPFLLHRTTIDKATDEIRSFLAKERGY